MTKVGAVSYLHLFETVDLRDCAKKGCLRWYIAGTVRFSNILNVKIFVGEIATVAVKSENTADPELTILCVYVCSCH